MSIYEYDQEKHIRQEREASWEEGREALLKEQIQKLAKELGISTNEFILLAVDYYITRQTGE